MQIVTADRKSENFRAAHRKHISASDVAHALSRRGSKRYNELINRLVFDFEDIGQHTDEHPDPWIESHELMIDEALAHYQLITHEPLQRVGFCVHDAHSWLGASPHALTERSCVHVRWRRSLKTFHVEHSRLKRAERARHMTAMFVCDRSSAEIIDYWSAGEQSLSKITRHTLDFDAEWFSSIVIPRLTTVWRDVHDRLRIRRP